MESKLIEIKRLEGEDKVQALAFLEKTISILNETINFAMENIEGTDMGVINPMFTEPLQRTQKKLEDLTKLYKQLKDDHTTYYWVTSDSEDKKFLDIWFNYQANETISQSYVEMNGKIPFLASDLPLYQKLQRKFEIKVHKLTRDQRAFVIKINKLHDNIRTQLNRENTPEEMQYFKHLESSLNTFLTTVMQGQTNYEDTYEKLEINLMSLNGYSRQDFSLTIVRSQIEQSRLLGQIEEDEYTFYTKITQVLGLMGGVSFQTDNEEQKAFTEIQQLLQDFLKDYSCRLEDRNFDTQKIELNAKISLCLSKIGPNHTVNFKIFINDICSLFNLKPMFPETLKLMKSISTYKDGLARLKSEPADVESDKRQNPDMSQRS